MTKGCEECKLIPAGVSKRTGKPYKAFYTCKNPDCPNYKGEYIPNKGRDTGVGALNTRLDNLAQYLAEEFEEIKTMLLDIQRK